MLERLTSFFRPNLQSLNTIYIHWDILRRNLSFLQWCKPDDAIFPVLKSNAYGHGLEQVAKALATSDVPYICVDSVPEYFLAKKYAKKPVLLIWETLPDNYSSLDHRWATPCIYNIATLKKLIATWRWWKVHLFLNTWMNREGIQIHELGAFLELLKDSKIELEWVMSHFANADEIDASFCDTQIEKFKEMTQLIRQYWFEPRYLHIWNSAWIAKIDDDFFTARRSWIAFYGYSPLQKWDPYFDALLWLTPALHVESRVVSIQRIVPWDLVSYWGKFVTQEPTTVATMPFWYTEWLNRKLLDHRSIGKDNMYYPLVGTICMNLSIVNMWSADISVWDALTVISHEKENPNSVYEFARFAETIPYEVLVNLDTKAKRILL